MDCLISRQVKLDGAVKGELLMKELQLQGQLHKAGLSPLLLNCKHIKHQLHYEWTAKTRLYPRSSFSQANAWLFLFSYAKLLDILFEKGKFGNRLSAQDVLFSEDGLTIQFLYCSLKPTEYESVLVGSKQQHDCALSAEGLQALKRGVSPAQTAQDLIFAGGVLLLKFLTQIKPIRGRTIVEKQYFQWAKLLRSKYSKSLTELLLSCLQFDPKVRMTLRELKQALKARQVPMARLQIPTPTILNRGRQFNAKQNLQHKTFEVKEPTSQTISLFQRQTVNRQKTEQADQFSFQSPITQDLFNSEGEDRAKQPQGVSSFRLHSEPIKQEQVQRKQSKGKMLPRTKHKVIYQSIINYLDKACKEIKLDNGQAAFEQSVGISTGDTIFLKKQQQQQQYYASPPISPPASPQISPPASPPVNQPASPPEEVVVKKQTQIKVNPKSQIVAQIQIYLSTLEQIFEKHYNQDSYYPLPPLCPLRVAQVQPGSCARLSQDHQGKFFAIYQFSCQQRFIGLVDAVSQEVKRGVYFWNDQKYYAGEFVNSREQGFGCLFAQGTIHLGYWYEGLRNGPGLEWVSSMKVKGEWVNGLQIKYKVGRIAYVNGDFYEGQIVNNERHGKGTYIAKNKNFRMEGTFEQDLLVQGSVFYSNGDVYEGMLKGGKREGKGRYTLADGQVFEGEWKEGRKHGVGMQDGRMGVWESGSLREWVD